MKYTIDRRKALEIITAGVGSLVGLFGFPTYAKKTRESDEDRLKEEKGICPYYDNKNKKCEQKFVIPSRNPDALYELILQHCPINFKECQGYASIKFGEIAGLWVDSQSRGGQQK